MLWSGKFAGGQSSCRPVLGCLVLCWKVRGSSPRVCFWPLCGEVCPLEGSWCVICSTPAGGSVWREGLPALSWATPPSHLFGHWSGWWVPLQVHPSLITGHPWDLPQFPGHLFRRRKSLQNCSPFGVCVAQFLGQLLSLPFEDPFDAFPFWGCLPLDHWGWNGDHEGRTLPLPLGFCPPEPLGWPEPLSGLESLS